jgi:predicted MFS family arabinose efflux permease
MPHGDLQALRRHPGYPLFYATATLTRFADEMFSVGVVLLVLHRTGSAALAGATVAAVTLPSLVTGPVLGAWLDRAGDRRRQAMILDQLLAATSLVGIVLLAGNAPDWTVPAVALVAGITWPLSFGGFTSLIPVIVPDELLAQANALEATSFNLAIIAGPALAGTISALWSPAASLLTEAGLTVAAIALIARVAAMDAAPRATTQPLGAIVRSGLLHLVRTPVLRGVSAAGALGLGGLGLLTVAFPFLAADELGVDRSVAGYMWASFAAGSMIGALLLVRLQTRFRPERVMLSAILALGLVMCTWPLASSVPAALGLIALGGLVDGPGLSSQFAARQRWTPSALLGQIFTTAASMKVGAFALGAAVAGPAVIALGARGTIVLAGCLQIAAVGLGLALGAAGQPATEQHELGVGAALPEPHPSTNPSAAFGPLPNPPGALAPDGNSSDLEQDDRVDEQRDGERHGPAIQVALDQGAAAERAGARAADAEGAREPAVLPRMQQHKEDQDHGDEHLQDGQERVHGRRL